MEGSDLNPNEALWPRYFLRISYNGTKYHGWQRQLNGHSVQAELEQALRVLLRQEKVITVGCGRTDTGVHAKAFYLHFNAEQEIQDPTEIVWKLNQILPKDIAAHELFRTADMAHARFDATERSYIYCIHRAPDPFRVGRSMLYQWPLDLDRMNEAAAMLVRHGDFASFCKSGGTQKTTICDVRKAVWTAENHRWYFHITADRFLRNMVRAVVGTLLDIGTGKMNPADLELVLQGQNRRLAGESVKACGLYLSEVKYPGFSTGASATELHVL